MNQVQDKKYTRYEYNDYFIWINLIGFLAITTSLIVFFSIGLPAKFNNENVNITTLSIAFISLIIMVILPYISVKSTSEMNSTQYNVTQRFNTEKYVTTIIIMGFIVGFCLVAVSSIIFVSIGLPGLIEGTGIYQSLLNFIFGFFGIIVMGISVFLLTLQN